MTDGFLLSDLLIKKHMIFVTYWNVSASSMNGPTWHKYHYDGRLRDVVEADLESLSSFMLDPNPNIRRAAKITYAQRKEKYETKKEMEK